MTRSRCKSCDAEIIWARTPNGKMMPLDAEPNPLGNRLLDDQGYSGPASKDATLFPEVRYMAHWATCPFAKEFRK